MKDLQKIILSALLLMISLLLKEPMSYVILGISYFIISYEMYIKAFQNMKEKEFFDENVLMILATIGAFYIGNTIEAVLVMLLYQIGEYLSDLAVERSKESITQKMDLRLEIAHIDNKDVPINSVKIGDVITVLPGERVPLDGEIVEGTAHFDTSSLTGEAKPISISKKDKVLSGYLNIDGKIKVKTTSTAKTSTAQRIIELIEDYDQEKSETETFIHRFAKIYTPIVVGIAFLLVFIPCLFGGDTNTWIYRALVFLVTSCPCALVISVPLGYFCGIGKCSKEGIVVKGSKELERLAEVDTIMLDKTGTITEGVFEVSEVKTTIDRKKFLQLVASCEENSLHPIAKAIKKKNKEELLEVKNYKEISGKGISCLVDNKKVLIGNKVLMEENNIPAPEIDSIGTIIYVAEDNNYLGSITVSDIIRSSSKKLRSLNYPKVVLSGDREEIVQKVAKEVGIKTSFGNLLPEGKAEKVKEYQKNGKVMFVGDGINDAYVLKVADIGVSMGDIGSDAAVEASDVIILDDDLSKIKQSINISKYTKKKVWQSIILALTIKSLVLILGVFGLSTVLLAVLADVGVTLLAIMNVLLIFIKKM